VLVYGPSKPSSLISTDGGFTPTASMAGLGEKLGMDPLIDQPFALGAVALSIAVDDFMKGCYTWTA
jgi:hypothetical protein